MPQCVAADLIYRLSDDYLVYYYYYYYYMIYIAPISRIESEALSVAQVIVYVLFMLIFYHFFSALCGQMCFFFSEICHSCYSLYTVRRRASQVLSGR